MKGVAFGRQFQAVQPLWSRVMFWLIGVPASAVFGAAIMTSMNGGLPMWGLLAFALLFAIGVIQWIIYFSLGRRNG